MDYCIQWYKEDINEWVLLASGPDYDYHKCLFNELKKHFKDEHFRIIKILERC